VDVCEISVQTFSGVLTSPTPQSECGIYRLFNSIKRYVVSFDMISRFVVVVRTGDGIGLIKCPAERLSKDK
jgi:hypothetical protein